METNATNSAAEAEATAVISEEKPKAPVDVLIHLRFQPDGTVSEIGERPANVTAQNWFNYLSRNTLNCYQALSGGRGIFRLPRQQIESLKTGCAQECAA